MNKRSGHYMTPFPNPALQRPELHVREPTRVIALQPFHQGLGRRIGIVLEPPEDLRPDFLEGVLAGSPGTRWG